MIRALFGLKRSKKLSFNGHFTLGLLNCGILLGYVLWSRLLLFGPNNHKYLFLLLSYRGISLQDPQMWDIFVDGS